MEKSQISKDTSVRSKTISPFLGSLLPQYFFTSALETDGVICRLQVNYEHKFVADTK